jgi:predicted nucleotidyltransferase
MLVAETLTGLQRELKLIVGNSLVLLGGSYFHGGATESSDIDFFVIVSWFNYFKVWRRRKVIRKWEGKSTEAKINVMIVPRFFYNRGWYYISGRGLGGKKYHSKVRHGLVLRNALKLSAFYGLKFLSGAGNDWLRKAGKQLAIAKLIKESNKKILLAVESIEWKKEGLLELAKGDVWKFSWANYIIYNLKFLLKFDLTFLFCNPDKLVWARLEKMLERGSVAVEEIAWAEKYVFPVIIL